MIKSISLVTLLLCCLIAYVKATETVPQPPATNFVFNEFDPAIMIAEGRLRIAPTDRRDYDRPPLRIKLPVTNGMPEGTKLVRLFFSDVSQAWCVVVTHPSYLKTSPAGAVPVMTLVLKVGE